MPRIKQVTWSRTVSKDFQSKRCEVTLEVTTDENVSYSETLQAARALVNRSLGLGYNDAHLDCLRRGL